MPQDHCDRRGRLRRLPLVSRLVILRHNSQSALGQTTYLGAAGTLAVMRRRRQERRSSLDRLMVIDIAMAVVFTAYGLSEVLTKFWPGPRPVSAAVVAVSGLSLIWRRRRPLAVSTVVFGAQTVLALAYGQIDTGASLLIGLVATLSVAAQGERLAYAAAVAGVFVAVDNFPRQALSEAVGDAVFVALVLGLAFAVGVTMRNRQAHTEALEARTAELEREQEARAAAAAAEERRRIARELHDIISHSLGLVVLQAGAAAQVLERDPARAREALALIRNVGQDAIGEMGTLVGLMRDSTGTPLEPQPSLADLDRLISTTRDAPAGGGGLVEHLDQEPRLALGRHLVGEDGTAPVP